jgi:hypothetical protein
VSIPPRVRIIVDSLLLFFTRLWPHDHICGRARVHDECQRGQKTTSSSSRDPRSLMMIKGTKDHYHLCAHLILLLMGLSHHEIIIMLMLLVCKYFYSTLPAAIFCCNFTFHVDLGQEGVIRAPPSIRFMMLLCWHYNAQWSLTY